MIETNLILVDGISGSGKSTTSQRLYNHLLSLGYPAQWAYEHDATHPIYPILEVEQALETGLPAIQQLQENALTRWQQVVDTLKNTRQILLLDGALFQLNVGLLSIGSGLSPAAIQANLQQIDSLIAPLHPVLIYFRQADITTLLQTTLAHRGEGYAQYLLYRLNRTPLGKEKPIISLEQVVALFEHFQQTVEALLPTLTLNHLTIDSSQRAWASYEQQIASHLQLPPIQDPATPFDELAPFAGQYQDENSDDIFTIVTDDSHLYLDQPPAKTRLYHKTGHTFQVEGISIEVTFGQNESGTIDRLECQSNLSGLSPIWRKLQI